jgi:hypothetical protein
MVPNRDIRETWRITAKPREIARTAFSARLTHFQVSGTAPGRSPAFKIVQDRAEEPCTL